MGVLWGENIVQESSRLPRFSLRLNPEPEVSPPWHSRPEDDRGDGAGAPPHGEGSLSRLCPPENCYASLTLRMSGHYRKPSTDKNLCVLIAAKEIVFRMTYFNQILNEFNEFNYS